MYNKLTRELAVCGLNAVRALGELHPEKINRLFLREERLPLFTRLCKNLAERKRPYKLCGDEELERVCKTNHHQGIVAMIFSPAVEAAAPEDIESWAAEGKTGLVLCDVGNDLNLGAIVRSAAFFDASPIILAGGGEDARRDTDRDADRDTGDADGDTGRDADGDAAEEEAGEPNTRLSTAAYRAAEGGMEHVAFRAVRNPAAFLRDAAKQLVTIGTDPRARLRIGDIPALLNERASAKQKKRPGVALVLGSEESGLSGEVKEQCSLLARIPGTGAIESLNVAQAAALFLRELYER
ncbi:MAG: RNA methyltransferase [Treponema sp.]|jgi:TrmH RNA methyltransferase|nr:RNA methyltransferase [Treponema sp.]